MKENICTNNPCQIHNDNRCCGWCLESGECEFVCGYLENPNCEHKGESKSE